ncbi:MAG: dihydroxy-acid dehydratase, partial [Betaproteobacteria bacterium]|nr:dihydroxy-acid dehydratase [Betaproteobacteria bacterium]
PLALVHNGDPILLDVEARRIDLQVPDAELAARKAAWVAPAPRFTRGFGALYLRHIEQADQGCDFDFLARDSTSASSGS